MKKFIFIITSSMLVMFGLNNLSLAKSVKIAADEWCPYNCVPNTSESGYMVEIAEHILGKQGYDIKYSIVPWSRAINQTREGNYDAVFGAALGDAEDFIFPKEEQGRTQMALYTLTTNDWMYKDPQSLKNISMAIISDYSYGEIIDTFIKDNPSKVQVSSGNDALMRIVQKILIGRVGVFPEDKAVMEYNIKALGIIGKLKESGIVSSGDEQENNLYIAFSPSKSESKILAELLSNGMKEIRANGKLEKILSKYGVKDWK